MRKPIADRIRTRSNITPGVLRHNAYVVGFELGATDDWEWPEYGQGCDIGGADFKDGFRAGQLSRSTIFDEARRRAATVGLLVDRRVPEGWRVAKNGARWVIVKPDGSLVQTAGRRPRFAWWYHKGSAETALSRLFEVPHV